MSPRHSSQRTPLPQRPCFSGSGAMTRSRWAPGADSRYYSRLCQAHLAGETMPDPWYVRDHGGVEADPPEGGWPQLDALEIAERLDEELISAARVWVPRLVDYHKRHGARAGISAERRQAAQERAALRQQVLDAQRARPDKGDRGHYFGQPATVRARMDPTRLLIETEDYGTVLISDGDFTREEATA